MPVAGTVPECNAPVVPVAVCGAVDGPAQFVQIVTVVVSTSVEVSLVVWT